MRTLFSIGLILFYATSADAKPDGARFFVVVQSVSDPTGAESALTAEVRALFITQLQHRADVMLTAPEWLSPKVQKHPAEMKAALAQRKMRAYNASIKIQSLSEKITPIASTPPRRQLEVTIHLSIFGDQLPDRTLKIGGDGEASDSVMVSETADLTQIKKKLTRTIAEAAIGEAISQTVKKIEIVAERERSGR